MAPSRGTTNSKLDPDPDVDTGHLSPSWPSIAWRRPRPSGSYGRFGKDFDSAGIPTRLHAFLDGRDTPPASAKDYVTRVIDQTVDLNDFAIATMSGRYYAMDRDQNWDRIERAYRALAEAVGQTPPTRSTP